MPIISLSTGNYAYTVDPSKSAPLAGTWGIASSGGGYTTLTTTGGNAIAVLLQGEFTDPTGATVISSPEWFGGITQNNDANQYAQVIQGEYAVTTTMPNSQSPLVNYVICESAFIVEVVRVIDNDNIVVKDPSGVTLLGGSYTLFGFSANSYPINNVTLNIDASSTADVYLPGQLVTSVAEGTITLTPNNYGACTPIMVKAATGTATLIYNE